MMGCFYLKKNKKKTTLEWSRFMTFGLHQHNNYCLKRQQETSKGKIFPITKIQKLNESNDVLSKKTRKLFLKAGNDLS